jgi:hypothetical protein
MFFLFGFAAGFAAGLFAAACFVADAFVEAGRRWMAEEHFQAELESRWYFPAAGPQQKER